MIFVISEDIDKAERFIEENKLCRRHVRHVFSALSLKGRPEGIMYITTNGWDKRSDSVEISRLLSNLKAVELKIK